MFFLIYWLLFMTNLYTTFLLDCKIFFMKFWLKTQIQNIFFPLLVASDPSITLCPTEATCTLKEAVKKSSYKAGRVHLLSADQICDVLSIVGDSFHASHKVFSPSGVRFCRDGHSSKTDLNKQQGVVCWSVMRKNTRRSQSSYMHGSLRAVYNWMITLGGLVEWVTALQRRGGSTIMV